VRVERLVETAGCNE